MKVKVNKNKWLEDYDYNLNHSISRGGLYDMSMTRPTKRGEFEEMEVTTMEELENLVNKGYGIKINC